MSATSEYFDSLRGKRIAVIGMGISNMPLIRMLLRSGLRVTVCDRADRTRLEESAQELESLGARLFLGEGYLEHLSDMDLIFRTPGLSPYTLELKQAVEAGAELTSEMELFFRLCPAPIIGVTGSDGKTTTTTLIAEFLKAAGKNVYVGGNIGRPLLSEVNGIEQEDFVVVELSSFQLMTMEESPHIAVFTNLAPNHLDYHRSMEEYTAAKENVFLHQNGEDRVILNLDNPLTRAMADRAPGAVTFFSRQGRLEEGVYLRDGAIWLTNGQGSREVLLLSDIRLPGAHNVENYMAAIAAVDGIVPDKVVREVARRFQGVEHRIELVREKDGVLYYNDSIGTSPSRTIACLHAFSKPVILIAGGYDKGISFAALGMEIPSHVKHLILTGDTADQIRRAVEAAEDYGQAHPEITVIAEFDDAVQMAAQCAQSGDIVVLSPACAAFDRFQNFMERGKHFKALVQAL